MARGRKPLPYKKRCGSLWCQDETAELAFFILYVVRFSFHKDPFFMNHIKHITYPAIMIRTTPCRIMYYKPCSRYVSMNKTISFVVECYDKSAVMKHPQMGQNRRKEHPSVFWFLLPFLTERMFFYSFLHRIFVGLHPRSLQSFSRR